ncbi:hypothetical protein [Mesorhizobium sp. NZP2077]|uniref:hypothetical protein n=1 Tax=Mesorhizobium sp. NZP2077 TaxID=2483404 RepID=UPI001FEF3AD9|nr:hypothetical protein [Mesorhizobium sp. NZP2077]
MFSLEAAFDKLKETVSEYDAISKNAKTSGLNTDTYQALGFAARQADIDQESLNSSLDIFAKNAGLAAHGTGSLYSGLKTLNPQLLQSIINTKDQEERLKLVADAMARTSDASQKAALSTIVFGKGGVEMSRLLDQGRASIEKFKKTAQGLGIIIPDELLAKAGELDEKLKVLGAVINHNIGEALINAAPAIVAATNDFANLSKEINGISKAMTEFADNPSLAKFRDLLSQITGLSIIPGSLADDVVNGMKFSAPDTSALTSGIDFLEKKLVELQAQAAAGADVHIEIADATTSLNDLKAKLAEVQGAGSSAANAISANFAQAFREAENASMDALAAMQGGSGGALPTVTRYGGDPNKITLPAQQYNEQTNVNGSGVNVRSYGAPDPNAKATAGNTQQTADNVSTLDRNTKSYLQSLSSDIGGYSAQQNITINKLSDVTAATFGQLSGSILQLLVSKTDTADNSAAGNGFLTHDQVFIPGMTSYAGKVPTIHLAPTTSDGSFNTSVNVQQPGTSITLNYVASANESADTAKQRARDMFNELVRAQASA